MAQVNNITNNESGLSVRGKLNQLIANNNRLDPEGKTQRALLFLDASDNLTPSGFFLDADGNLTTARDITTTGRIQSGLATLGLGETHSIYCGAEIVAIRNEVMERNYHPGWQMMGTDGAWNLMQRTPLQINNTYLQENQPVNTDNSTDITNPDFEMDSLTISHRLYAFTIEPTNSITDVTLEVFVQENAAFKPYFEITGVDLVGGAAQKISFLPFDLAGNQRLQIRATSPNGDVVVKGSAGGMPYLLLDYIQYEDRPVALSQDVLNAEAIFNLVADALQAGNGIAIDRDDDNNTLTIRAGQTPNPTPSAAALKYGLSTESAASNVTLSSLTDVADPTDPQTVSTGETQAGEYFWIFQTNAHDIQSITDTVLQQVVYQRGGSGNIFQLFEDAATEGDVTYDALRVGPFNAGVDEDYVLRYS